MRRFRLPIFVAARPRVDGASILPVALRMCTEIANWRDQIGKFAAYYSKANARKQREIECA